MVPRTLLPTCSFGPSVLCVNLIYFKCCKQRAIVCQHIFNGLRQTAVLCKTGSALSEHLPGVENTEGCGEIRSLPCTVGSGQLLLCKCGLRRHFAPPGEYHHWGMTTRELQSLQRTRNKRSKEVEPGCCRSQHALGLPRLTFGNAALEHRSHLCSGALHIPLVTGKTWHVRTGSWVLCWKRHRWRHSKEPKVSSSI